MINDDRVRKHTNTGTSALGCENRTKKSILEINKLVNQHCIVETRLIVLYELIHKTIVKKSNMPKASFFRIRAHHSASLAEQ